jgi:hypothetical protein
MGDIGSVCAGKPSPARRGRLTLVTKRIGSVLFSLRPVLYAGLFAGVAYAFGPPEVRFDMERWVVAVASTAANLVIPPIDAAAVSLGWKQDTQQSAPAERSAAETSADRNLSR